MVCFWEWATGPAECWQNKKKYVFRHAAPSPAAYKIGVLDNNVKNSFSLVRWLNFEKAASAQGKIINHWPSALFGPPRQQPVGLLEYDKHIFNIMSMLVKNSFYESWTFCFVFYSTFILCNKEYRSSGVLLITLTCIIPRPTWTKATIYGKTFQQHPTD